MPTPPAVLSPEIDKAIRASFVRQGLMGTLGARLASLAPGRIVIEVPFTQPVSQQHGLFHGGVIGAVGDTAAGYAAMSLLPAGSEVLTVEYKVNFMRAAKGTLLRAAGEVVRSGRTVSVVRADVSCGDGWVMEPCGLLQATMLRVSG